MSKRLRPVTLRGAIVEVPLASGRVAITDSKFAEIVGAYNWSEVSFGNVSYAYANQKVGHRKFKTIRMHRLIYKVETHEIIDHINGDGLDNRVANLRKADRAQNNWNSLASSLNKSGVKGVHWNRAAGKWTAGISARGKRYFLGYFTTIPEAKAAYDSAAKTLHSDFRRAC